MAKTLEHFVRTGGDLTACIREETLLMHASAADNKNTLEARVLARIVLPDGTEFCANKVIKVRFKRENKPCPK